MKQIKNIRNNHKEETIQLKSVSKLQLEEILTKIQTDELLEVTPKALRLRKSVLASNERRAMKRKGNNMDV